MVNEPAVEEAVAIARENPRLGVGLHMALLFGRSALPHDQIPGICDPAGRFPETPVATGMRYFFRRNLKSQIEAELEAQFAKFHATGLPLDHVNGHLHFHLHPVVFEILMRNSTRWGIKRLRLTCDSLKLSARMAPGRWGYRISHAFVYWCLSRWAKSHLDRRGIRYTRRVFGLLHSGRVDEAYIADLLQQLPEGDSELYSHPSLDQSQHEFAALISPKNVALVRQLDIQLIRYQDL